MNNVIPCGDQAECEALGSFLADRIYEFNAKATGYFDGMLLGGCIRNDAGDVIAGFNGYTWGGCCELSHGYRRGGTATCCALVVTTA